MEESNNNMDTEVLTANYQRSIPQRLLSAVVPVLLIAVGYVDPGKWAAVVEGGARCGSDLITLMLIFNLAAVVFQYLSAHVTVVTGKNLAQICSKEYDNVTCIILGIQAELSMITLDLTKILGTVHWLNLISGVDLFTCVFLTAIEAVLFPLFATLLENGKAKFLCICTASSMLIFCLFDVHGSQTEISLSMGGMLTKLSGESAFVLMSLLGASVVPHNFYLLSSIIQQDQTRTVDSKGALCHDQFFAILCAFSGIFLVYCVLMNSAANVFYSTGSGLLTFQDALSVMDQVFRSPIAPSALILVMFLSNQITALTWNLGRQIVLYDFLGLDIPGWLHHVTIRLIAIIPALYCLYNSGGEGIYQLLIVTQVVVALMLPASVIPLFRVASSRAIMGSYKMSQLVEFISLMMFIGMAGLKILFVIELIFGDSDWVSNLRWDMENISFAPYAALLVTAFVSLCLMLWLAAIPLRSDSSRLDIQAFNWEMQTSVPKSFAERNDSQFIETEYCVDEPIQKKEQTFGLGKSLGIHLDLSSSSPDSNLPETLLDSDIVPQLTTVEANSDTFSSPCHPEELSATVDKVLVSTVCSRVSDSIPQDDSPSVTELKNVVEKTLRIEGESQNEKDEGGDTLEPEESSKGMSVSSPFLTSDGPGSFRSLSGKSDDVGSGTGSLSRSSGLGRSAKRQLTVFLGEFWGQLFDSHGQVTQEARAKKLDMLLGIDAKVDTKVDPKLTSVSSKVDNNPMESTGYFQSFGGRGSDPLMKSGWCDPFKQQRGQGCMEPSCGVRRGPSSPWSSHMELLDAYVQNSCCNTLDFGERRYSSLRFPASSDGYDNQPATIHGYKIASYLNRIGKERNSDYLNGEISTQYPKSSSLRFSDLKDAFAFTLGQKRQNGLKTSTPPGFSNVAISRNSSLQQGTPLYDLSSSGPTENVGNTLNAKKFCSLPDISGLSNPLWESSLSERSVQWNNPMGYGLSLDHTASEQSLYLSPLRDGSSMAFDEFSPSKVSRDTFSLHSNSSSDTGSLWSKQPFEQFGVAGKNHSGEGEGIVNKGSSVPDTTSMDLEAELLQSFRHCIVKLLKLEGSDWLFRQNDGADEDLIGRVAARERFLYEAETREINWVDHMGESQFSSDRRSALTNKNDEADYTKFLVTSFPHCGEGCIWKVDLIVSFGVWCIHRVLELSVMESRPELWGKYTYVLNRLQGIIDLAFSKPRSPVNPCFCLQIARAYQQRFSPPMSNRSLPPPAKQGRGKCTTAAMLLDIIKDVEMAISCRKGKTGTTAGDVAFPKGKENLASVLKRYKRRLGSK